MAISAIQSSHTVKPSILNDTPIPVELEPVIDAMNEIEALIAQMDPNNPTDAQLAALSAAIAHLASVCGPLENDPNDKVKEAVQYAEKYFNLGSPSLLQAAQDKSPAEMRQAFEALVNAPGHVYADFLSQLKTYAQDPFPPSN